MAPCLSTSMSSMLSAPAAIPATRQPTFMCAFTPVRLASLTCSPTRSARPQRSEPRRAKRFARSRFTNYSDRTGV
jgi:hypothetical protein